MEKEAIPVRNFDSTLGSPLDGKNLILVSSIALSAKSYCSHHGRPHSCCCSCHTYGIVFHKSIYHMMSLLFSGLCHIINNVTTARYITFLAGTSNVMTSSLTTMHFFI